MSEKIIADKETGIESNLTLVADSQLLSDKGGGSSPNNIFSVGGLYRWESQFWNLGQKILKKSSNFLKIPQKILKFP